MTDVPLLIRLLICFLLGSIPFAVLAMRGTGVDIRRAGSGNPGFNNVLRFSKARAAITLLGDFGKGFLALWLFHQAGGSIARGWLYAAAVTIGHCYSPWLKFRGGKGIATSGGAMLLLYPAFTAMLIGVFAALRVTGAKLKWVEAGTIASLTSWLLFTVVLLGVQRQPDALYAALMTLFLAWRHKSNFRILAEAARAARFTSH